MTILVGTASWTDPTLIKCKRFYPKGVNTAEGRLAYYASRFPVAENDSAYYSMPSADLTRLWAARTPPDFLMNIKAFRLFTNHQTPPTSLHADIQAALPSSLVEKPQLYYRDMPAELLDEMWRRYREAIQPLKDAGQLGLVHFQFPPWVRNGKAGRAQVEECVRRMQGTTLSVEFRHSSWFDAKAAADTLRFERDLGVVHTVVDEPQGFDNSVPAIWEATRPDFGLVRLHGRNAETWNIQDSTSASNRFNYDYSPAELRELAEMVKRYGGMFLRTVVLFNNNLDDQGQRNGKSLMDILAELQADVIRPYEGEPEQMTLL